jgi:hypothetical protein
VRVALRREVKLLMLRIKIEPPPLQDRLFSPTY